MTLRFDAATAIGDYARARDDGSFAISLTRDKNDPCQIEFKPDGTVDVPSGCTLLELATGAAETMMRTFDRDDVKPDVRREIFARLIYVALRASVLNPLDKMTR